MIALVDAAVFCFASVGKQADLESENDGEIDRENRDDPSSLVDSSQDALHAACFVGELERPGSQFGMLIIPDLPASPTASYSARADQRRPLVLSRFDLSPFDGVKVNVDSESA